MLITGSKEPRVIPKQKWENYPVQNCIPCLPIIKMVGHESASCNKEANSITGKLKPKTLGIKPQRMDSEDSAGSAMDIQKKPGGGAPHRDEPHVSGVEWHAHWYQDTGHPQLHPKPDPRVRQVRAGVSSPTFFPGCSSNFPNSPPVPPNSPQSISKRKVKDDQKICNHRRLMWMQNKWGGGKPQPSRWKPLSPASALPQLSPLVTGCLRKGGSNPQRRWGN